MPSPKSVVVTGASGLLGRAVVDRFENNGDKVIPLAWTRADEDSRYTKLDLMDERSVEDFFSAQKVDVVIHCERAAMLTRSVIAEPDDQALLNDDRMSLRQTPRKQPKPLRTPFTNPITQINAGVPAHLSKLSREKGFPMVYISTDYVFNGRNPPYEVNDEPDPLQAYGRQKRDGELAVLKEREQGAPVTVLRVPVLYGKTKYNAESAVNILRDVVEDQSGKEYKMDHYQVRFPTNVDDIGRLLVDLTHLEKPLPAILHYASPAPALTKYDMTKIIAEHLDLPIDHVKPDSARPVSKPGQTERPENTQLSTKSLEELGVDTREDADFETWWAKYIKETK